MELSEKDMEDAKKGISAIQRLVSIWSRNRNFDKSSIEFLLIAVTTEVGELLSEWKKSYISKKMDTDNFAKEIVDIIIDCSLIANKMNLDLDKYFESKLREITQRWPIVNENKAKGERN